MRTLLAAAALIGAAANTAAAADIASVPVEAPSGLAVTVYVDGLAFVRDHREADLPGGAAHLDFPRVSREMVPGSAWLETAKGTRVVSLDTGFELLTPQALLRRAVGGPVLILHTNPQTGEESSEPATLLAAEPSAIVRTHDRIETVPPERIAFPSLPAGLATAPQLTASVDTASPGRQPLTLSYLTGGLGWSANYVITVDDRTRHAAVAGRAAIINTSGMPFANASVGLIAGQLNRVTPGPAPKLMRVEAMAAPADAAPPQREALADLHLYRLPQPITLDDQQTRQFTLFDATDLPVSRTYISEGGAAWQPLRGAEPQPTHPRVHLAFTAPGGETAQPFPQGVARIFTRDDKGELRLIGEDQVPPTPAGGRIELDPGEAFDITVLRRQTDFVASREPNGYTEAAWQIAVANGKDEAVDVRLVEALPGDWKILSETAPHEKETADRVVWTLAVPAHGKAEVAYRVRSQR